MGAMMGGTVGLCIGLMFGTMNVVRYGPGQRGYLNSIGQYMVGSAASFGLFMSIGAVVRSEGLQNSGPYRRSHIIAASIHAWDKAKLKPEAA